MTQSRPGPTSRTPRHLWVIGIVALLWNAIGAFDYLMTQTKNAAYLSGFPPEQLAFFYGLPAWVVAAWALAVWGGVLGSVLLLLRRRLAVPVFARFAGRDGRHDLSQLGAVQRRRDLPGHGFEGLQRGDLRHRGGALLLRPCDARARRTRLAHTERGNAWR